MELSLKVSDLLVSVKTPLAVYNMKAGDDNGVECKDEPNS